MIILIVTFLLTGLFSGLIAGLLGVGGGIIIVPVSYFILLQLGYSIDVVMHVSVASSLCIIVFTSISSVLSHIKLNNVILLMDMLVWGLQLYVKLKHILL